MIHDYAQDTAHVAAHASLYAVVKFTQRGQFTRVECNSLEQARAVAKRLYRGATPVGITALPLVWMAQSSCRGTSRIIRHRYSWPWLASHGKKAGAFYP